MKNIIFIPSQVLFKGDEVTYQKIARQILIQWNERNLGTMSFLSFNSQKMRRIIKTIRKTLFFVDSTFLSFPKMLTKWDERYQELFERVVYSIECSDTIIVSFPEKYLMLLDDVLREHIQLFTNSQTIPFKDNVQLIDNGMLFPLVQRECLHLVA